MFKPKTVNDSLTATWGELVKQVPVLAEYAESRFKHKTHHVIATIRKDGSPRIGGTNVLFGNGRLFIGMMPEALRVKDLQTNGLCAIHSAPTDEMLSAGSGDVRLDAFAVPLEFDAISGLETEGGINIEIPPEGTYFELLIKAVSVVEVDGDRLFIRKWTPLTGLKENRY